MKPTPPLTIQRTRSNANGRNETLSLAANDRTVASLLVAVIGMCLLAYILKG